MNLVSSKPDCSWQIFWKDAFSSHARSVWLDAHAWLDRLYSAGSALGADHGVHNAHTSLSTTKLAYIPLMTDSTVFRTAGLLV